MKIKILFFTITVTLCVVFFSCKTTSEAAVEDQLPAGQAQQESVQPVTNPVLYKDLDLNGAIKHKVTYRDTLSSIAKKYYGNDKGYFFPLILEASKESITNPEIIIPGTILIIPDLNKNIGDPARREYVKSLLLETSKLYQTKKTYFSPKISTELRKTAESL